MNEKKEMKPKMNHWILTLVIAVAVGALSFFGGIKYQQSKIPVFGNGRFGGNMNFQNKGNGQGMFGNGGRGGFRPVSGQVINEDDKSMTVKLSDGSTKIVLLSATTLYSKSNNGSQSDVTTGSTVAVFGTENSDGSVTAQSVQLNPQMREGTATPSASPAMTK